MPKRWAWKLCAHQTIRENNDLCASFYLDIIGHSIKNETEQNVIEFSMVSHKENMPWHRIQDRQITKRLNCLKNEMKRNGIKLIQNVFYRVCNAQVYAGYFLWFAGFLFFQQRENSTCCTQTSAHCVLVHTHSQNSAFKSDLCAYGINS